MRIQTLLKLPALRMGKALRAPMQILMAFTVIAAGITDVIGKN